MASCYDQALRDMRAAVADLERRRILPTPLTLLVWYCHVSGQCPDLSREITASMADGQGLSDCDIAALSRHLLGAAPELIDEIGRRIEQTLEATAERIGAAACQEKRYGRDLQSFEQAVSAEDNAQTLHTLVVQLLERTKAMQEQTEELQRQLLGSSSTVTMLRQDLEIARREANVDGLTGIANRRAFEFELARLAAEAELDGTRFCVLLADIDHFKQFNDNYGHVLGDQLLKLVAKTIVRCVKGQDVVARYGGEEFAVILPTTKLADALKVATQIKNAVAANRLKLRHSNKDLGTVTLSIGVAEFQCGAPPAHVIARADKGLYRAKAAGRNRAMASEDETTADVNLSLVPAGPEPHLQPSEYLAACQP